jgi:hypothetical protein
MAETKAVVDASALLIFRQVWLSVLLERMAIARRVLMMLSRSFAAAVGRGGSPDGYSKKDQPNLEQRPKVNVSRRFRKFIGQHAGQRVPRLEERCLQFAACCR